MKNKINNTVIKVLNVEHGREIIQYFKSLGIDTSTYSGNSVGEYYGIINNYFGIFTFTEIRTTTKIITLPEISFGNLPIEISAWNSKNEISNNFKTKTILIAILPGATFPYITLECGNTLDTYKKNIKCRTVRAFKFAEPFIKPDIDITIKINGKIAKLSDISEETLTKIRNFESSLLL